MPNDPTIAAVALTAGLCSAVARADDAGSLNQKLWLRVNAFRPGIDSKVRVDHPQTSAPGTEVEFEDLGLARRKTLPTLLLGGRFGDGWRAEFEYLRLSRSGRVTLGQLLNFDDTTFPVQGVVSTDFKSDIYRASIGYSFLRTPQAELGAVVGLHVTRFDLSIEGNVSALGQPAAVRREEEHRTVPLPTVGLYGAWAFAPHWETTARLDVFSLRHSSYDGRLFNAQANLIYRFTSNVGVGLGYRYDDYRLESSKQDFRGFVDYKFNGPQAFVEAGF